MYIAHTYQQSNASTLPRFLSTLMPETQWACSENTPARSPLCQRLKIVETQRRRSCTDDCSKSPGVCAPRMHPLLFLLGTPANLDHAKDRCTLRPGICRLIYSLRLSEARPPPFGADGGHGAADVLMRSYTSCSVRNSAAATPRPRAPTRTAGHAQHRQRQEAAASRAAAPAAGASTQRYAPCFLNDWAPWRTPLKTHLHYRH